MAIYLVNTNWYIPLISNQNVLIIINKNIFPVCKIVLISFQLVIN